MGIAAGMGREGSTTTAPAYADYEPAPFWDEAFAARAEPRPHYRALLQALAGEDLAGRLAALRAAMSEGGVVFGGEDGVHPFLVDPVPRIVTAAEWEPLERGLAQRVRALNRFIADVYGERAIVREGVLPRRVIEEADHFEPLLVGRVAPAHGAWATVAGLDLVRGADGEWAVLEDNLRTPSGLAYVLAAREGVAPGLPGEPRHVRERARELLGAALLAAAPQGRAEPLIVLLTDGPSNSAYWEHRALAALLDIRLATLGDLEHRGGELVLSAGDAAGRRVDVVYRRTDEDRLSDERGALTAVGEALLEPWSQGRIGLANAFGTGVADDKLAQAHAEDMVRFYLGEEPLLPSVTTYDLGDPSALEPALDRLEELVVKPRAGYGGDGVVLCSQVSREEVARLREAIRAAPQRFIAQETVSLSRHPTVIGDRLRPRHVDLRPFAFSGERVEVLPGGLTRVAFDAGAMVVNSSQNGGGKDTWVMG
jgi:uncharacterized circularly permuted ATP-grasp superfamily protein